MSLDKYGKVARTTAIWLLILGGWFLLCFIGGINYLVTPWRIEHGVWFWVSIEEQMLEERYPEYAKCRGCTKRYIPFLV